MEKIELPECERGNTWLIEDERQLFLARLEPDHLDSGGTPLSYHWLQITITPGNHPGFCLSVISLSEEALAAHIMDKWAGAFAKRLNIDGVRLSETSTVMKADGLKRHEEYDPCPVEECRGQLSEHDVGELDFALVCEICGKRAPEIVVVHMLLMDDTTACGARGEVATEDADITCEDCKGASNFRTCGERKRS